jgi:hypothetical protein
VSYGENRRRREGFFAGMDDIMCVVEEGRSE